MKKLCCLILCLCACSHQAEREIVTMAVSPGPFEIVVEPTGYLKAVKATTISAPPSQTGPSVIAWIEEEGKAVKKGDILVRFDESALRLREVESTVQIKSLGYKMAMDGRRQSQDTNSLSNEIFVLNEERNQKARFAPKDANLFARNEIIESEVNLGFLDSKVDYFDLKKDRQLKQAATEQEIYQLNRKGEELQLDQVHGALKNMAVEAPHDGTFYYERNYRGEAPRTGQMAWSGLKLGSLPDLDMLEAHVFLLEKEASGIKQGLEASITLDANPGVQYPAKVKQVATLAKPLDRESPVSYFEVVLELSKTDPHIMRPGGLVRSRIFIAKSDSVVSLPNQALFSRDEVHWVYVKEGSEYVKREVTLGLHGPTKTIIEKGLAAGDQVALCDPTQEPKS